MELDLFGSILTNIQNEKGLILIIFQNNENLFVTIVGKDYSGLQIK